MTVRRIVPNVQTEALRENRDFYGLLGFEEVMDHGWVVALASPGGQLGFVTADRTAPAVPDLSIEVDDVDAVHATLRAAGAEIVHPLQDEEWGVRRFFVRDPNGRILNILSHL
ncbi:VOC family protein [Actinomadura parmotrematis]|uniref:VOC family protein n=1 Tax=Actinomadura parmotrematis TaxID=2864039 RepID=A0ABS7FLZ1_9ACTN|nr:VOC family protein [Actinomadura parmotrematis]MBW8481393.1 VOC family protein [Actinomadura parmotrematis]